MKKTAAFYGMVSLNSPKILYNSILVFFILFNSLLLAQSNTVTNDSIQLLIESGIKNIKLKNFDQGISQLTEVFEFGKSTNNNGIIADAANALGVAFFEINNIDKASEYFIISIEKEESKENLATDYNNLANIFEMKNDTLNALKYYNLGRDLYLKEKDTFEIVWPSANIGLIKLGQKKYVEAKILLEEVIKYYIPDSAHDPLLFVHTSIALAEIEYKTKNYDLAELYLKKADSVSFKNEDYDALLDAEKTRYNAYKKQNNLEKINSSLEKQINYLSLSKESQEEWLIKTSKLEQKLSENEKTIEFNAKINATQKETLRKTNLFNICILILLVATFITLYLLDKSNRTRKKLNKELINNNKELLTANEEIEYASKLKENFLSTISHELRTPLNAVTGITDILIEENPKQEQKENLKILKSSSEYLLSLINNVLQINKIEANKVELNLVSFNIKSISKNIKDALNYLVKENNNSLELKIDKNVPQLLKGDSLKLTQVILNLINNALKFTNNGKVLLSIAVVAKTDRIVTLKISIIDTGIGIQKKIQNKIFDDFFQESMLLDRSYEGTGLGLSIVKRLLIAMGSKINVDSEYGKGSNFWFNIKFEEIENNEFENLIQENYDLTSYHFLVVDDNSVNQMITKRIIEKKNGKVTLANNGFEAIEKTKTIAFNIILMDIHMPEMNGYQAAEGIRKFNKTTPIIALTALTVDENKKQLYDSGMNGVIIKPFVLDNFFNELSKFIKFE